MYMFYNSSKLVYVQLSSGIADIPGPTDMSNLFREK